MNRQYTNLLLESSSNSDRILNEGILNRYMQHFDCPRCAKYHKENAGLKVFSFMLLQAYKLRGKHMKEHEKTVYSLRRAQRRAEDELQVYHNRENSITKRNEKMKSDLLNLKQNLLAEKRDKDKLHDMLASLKSECSNLKKAYEKKDIEYKELKGIRDELISELSSRRKDIVSVMSRLKTVSQNAKKYRTEHENTFDAMTLILSVFNSLTKSLEEEINQATAKIEQLKDTNTKLNAEMLSEKLNMMVSFADIQKRNLEQIENLTNELKELQVELNKSITYLLRKLFAQLWQHCLQAKKKAFIFSNEILYYFLPALPLPQHKC